MSAPATNSPEHYVDLLCEETDSFTARRVIREVQALIPSSDVQTRGALLAALGIAYCHLGDQEKSLSNHRNAILSDRGNHQHYTNYGVSLKRLGLEADALEQHLIAVSKPGGQNPIALGNLAVALWDNDLFDDALEVLREAVLVLDQSRVYDRPALVLARLCASMGQDRLALLLTAKLVAARYGIALDDQDPLKTVLAAPREFQPMIDHSRDLDRVVRFASQLTPSLDAPAGGPRRLAIGAKPTDVERAVFEQTTVMRGRATAAEEA